MRIAYPVKQILLLLLCIVFTGPFVSGQNVRCTYSFWRQRDSDKKYTVSKDMLLDCFNGRGAFYCERSFIFDSLMASAFSSNGTIVGRDALDELDKIGGGTPEWSFIDYKKAEYIRYYRLSTYLLSGNDALTMPSWELLDEEKEIGGYLCNKAKANYMGRIWTIWFTEDVPSFSGPWLLWAAPGLIVDARDAEGLFVFRLTKVEPLFDDSRMIFMQDFYSGRYPSAFQCIALTAERADSMYLKMCTDADFFMQMMGGGSFYRISSDGSKTQISLPRITPLVPPKYWETR